MFELCPTIQESLMEKYPNDSSRARVEDKLKEYPPAAQKRWVTNPLVEFILQGYINNLAAGNRAVPSMLEQPLPFNRRGKRWKRKRKRKRRRKMMRITSWMGWAVCSIS
jgi:hypothetical protein